MLEGVRGGSSLELVLVLRIEKCIRPAGGRACGRACLWLGGLLVLKGLVDVW